jgi:hypothetical protein
LRRRRPLFGTENGDGAIDDTDLYAFIARYGITLSPP